MLSQGPICIVCGLAIASPGATWAEPAPDGGREQTPAQRTLRAAFFAYGHVLEDLDAGTRYSQTFSFRPRATLGGGYFVGLRLDLDVALTSSDVEDSDATWVSDLFLDTGLDMPGLAIPVLQIRIGPRLRIGAPTSRTSRDQQLILSLAPGVQLSRALSLLEGPYLNRLELFYRFFSYKYFHEQELGTGSGCACGSAAPTDIDDPGLQPQAGGAGVLNASWRLENTLGLRLHLLTRLVLAASVVFLDGYLYALEETTLFTPQGVPIVIPASESQHVGSLHAFFDLTWRALGWLWISAGVSHGVELTSASSTSYGPFHPSRTAVHLQLTVPVDGVVAAIAGS